MLHTTLVMYCSLMVGRSSLTGLKATDFLFRQY